MKKVIFTLTFLYFIFVVGTPVIFCQEINNKSYSGKNEVIPTYSASIADYIFSILKSPPNQRGNKYNLIKINLKTKKIESVYQGKKKENLTTPRWGSLDMISFCKEVPGEDSQIVVLDLKTKKRIIIFNGYEPLWSLDGKKLASLSNKTIEIREINEDLKNNKPIKEIKIPNELDGMADFKMIAWLPFKNKPAIYLSCMPTISESDIKNPGSKDFSRQLYQCTLSDGRFVKTNEKKLNFIRNLSQNDIKKIMMVDIKNMNGNIVLSKDGKIEILSIKKKEASKRSNNKPEKGKTDINFMPEQKLYEPCWSPDNKFIICTTSEVIPSIKE